LLWIDTITNMVVAKVPVSLRTRGRPAYGAVIVPSEPKGEVTRMIRDNGIAATIKSRLDPSRGVRLRTRVGLEHREEPRVGDSPATNAVIAEIPVDTEIVREHLREHGRDLVSGETCVQSANMSSICAAGVLATRQRRSDIRASRWPIRRRR